MLQGFDLTWQAIDPMTRKAKALPSRAVNSRSGGVGSGCGVGFAGGVGVGLTSGLCSDRGAGVNSGGLVVVLVLIVV